MQHLRRQSLLSNSFHSSMYDQWRPRHKQHLRGVHAWQVTNAPVLKLLFNIFISLLCCNKKKPAIYGGTRVSKTKNPSSPQSIYNKNPIPSPKRRPCYMKTITINHKTPALSRLSFNASILRQSCCIMSVSSALVLCLWWRLVYATLVMSLPLLVAVPPTAMRVCR